MILEKYLYYTNKSFYNDDWRVEKTRIFTVPDYYPDILKGATKN